MAGGAAVSLALTSTTQSVHTLAAATYIVPGLFNYPFIPPSITATTGAASPTPLIVSDFLGLLLPPPGGVGGIETGSVVFGYSWGAAAATTYKQGFNQFWANNPKDAPEITFVLLSNPDRPNGGIYERLNLGATPTETAGAASGDITTYDIARQYDWAADYPINPLHLLAFANANIGFVLVHMEYFGVNMSQAVLQGTFGDTKYFLIPTYPLPLLMPLYLIPLAGPVLADMLDPTLRVLVEAGYDRTINPGVPTPFNLAYFPDPTALANNFDLAVLTGSDNGLEDLGLGRPFGTVRPGPYGVGGPPVTVATTSTQQSVSQPASTPPTTTPAPSPTTMSPAAVAAEPGPAGTPLDTNLDTTGASDVSMPIAAPAKEVASPRSKVDTPSAHNADATQPDATSNDKPTTRQATQTPSTPSTQLAANSARPTRAAPIESELPKVKHPKVSGGSSTDGGDT